MKKLFLIFALFLLSSFCAFGAEDGPKETYTSSAEGIVLRIDYDYTEKTDNPADISKQIATVKITSGEFKGKTKVTENLMTGNPAYEVFLKEGQKVLLVLESQTDSPKSIDEVDVFITDVKRIGTIYFYFGLFVLFLVAIGRKKGLLSLLSIVLTVLLIFLIFVPCVLSGISPIISALIISILSTVITIYLVAGVNPKTNAAIMGTILSLVFASILAIISVKMANLTGFMGEESVFLYTQRPDLSFTGILAASMIIAALGALMDIAVSISSTINEIHITDRNLSIISLFKSGMNVGRDIIGTMANTLILVYLGSAMSLVLLASNIDTGKFFNLNQVAGEILSALTGSISLLACVPLTAIMAAYLVKRPKFPSFLELKRAFKRLPFFKDKENGQNDKEEAG